MQRINPTTIISTHPARCPNHPPVIAVGSGKGGVGSNVDNVR